MTTTTIDTTADALHLRTGLPAEFRYLEPECGRAAWPTMRLHPSAEHWLQIHGWFRGGFKHLTDLGVEWREGRLEPRAYRAQSLPVLQQVLNHLHGHHNIESHSYFPALARLEPKMRGGFELLDRDHDAIDGIMTAMMEAAIALHRVGEAPDLSPQTDALVGQIERGSALMTRHLDDEEEIIVPVFTLRGDPFEHM